MRKIRSLWSFYLVKSFWFFCDSYQTVNQSVIRISSRLRQTWEIRKIFSKNRISIQLNHVWVSLGVKATEWIS